MAKRLSKAGKDTALEYLFRLRNAYENAESKLEESLLLYEMSAAMVLTERFMTEEAAWMEGYDAEALTRPGEWLCDACRNYYLDYHDDKKLKRKEEIAIETLWMIGIYRRDIDKKNSENALLGLKGLADRYHLMRTKERQIKGGSRDKRNKGLIEAVEQVRSSLKGKVTCGTILRQFRTKHNSRKNALATDSGFGVYLADDLKGRESFYIIDKRGKEDRRGLAAFIKTYLKKNMEDSNYLP